MLYVVKFIFLTQINPYEINLFNVTAISKLYGKCPK